MTSTQWKIVLEIEPDIALRAKILEPLDTDNYVAAGPGHWGLLVVTVRGQDDTIIGGLWGQTGYGFLFVEFLALGPAKGMGLGRKVMELAEQEAKRRGLIGIWLDTFSFQAPNFYLKLGFKEFGRVTDFPPGYSRVFYVKRFSSIGVRELMED